MNAITIAAPTPDTTAVGRLYRRWQQWLPTFGWAAELVPTRANAVGRPVDAERDAWVARRDQAPMLIETLDQITEHPLAGRIVATMWESPRLPAASVARLNQARCVVTPSTWGATSFAASGVTRPLRIVHLGYDPSVFCDDGILRRPGSFAIAGRWGHGRERKGFDIAIEAFSIVRRHYPSATLAIKLWPDDPFETQAPGVQLHSEFLTDDELGCWYRQHAVYLAIARAEGFGLHALEAMASGCALVGHTWGGQGEYFAGVRVPYLLEPCALNPYQGNGCWGSAEVAPLAEAMLWTIEHAEDTEALRHAGLSHAAGWTWQQSTYSLVRVLEEFLR